MEMGKILGHGGVVEAASAGPAAEQAAQAAAPIEQETGQVAPSRSLPRATEGDMGRREGRDHRGLPAAGDELIPGESRQRNLTGKGGDCVRRKYIPGLVAAALDPTRILTRLEPVTGAVDATGFSMGSSPAKSSSSRTRDREPRRGARLAGRSGFRIGRYG